MMASQLPDSLCFCMRDKVAFVAQESIGTRNKRVFGCSLSKISFYGHNAGTHGWHCVCCNHAQNKAQRAAEQYSSGLVYCNTVQRARQKPKQQNDNIRGPLLLPPRVSQLANLTPTRQQQRRGENSSQIYFLPHFSMPFDHLDGP